MLWRLTAFIGRRFLSYEIDSDPVDYFEIFEEREFLERVVL